MLFRQKQAMHHLQADVIWYNIKRKATERERETMDLTKLREQIDEVDRQIVELYERRMEICGQVAQYKIETGKKVFDKEREEEKLRKVKSMTHSEFNSHGIEELFEQIMSMSRKLQYKMLTEKGSSGRLPCIAVDRLGAETARVVFPGGDCQ